MSNGGSYDPQTVESEMYRFWEEGGYFHAQPNPAKKPFVIDIPLPNVTGALHLGHALNNTLQDILIRRKRMCGYEALWMPGTDHAGIATQAVVERKLKEEQHLTRHELGREGLVAKIWEWKEKYGGQILTQLRGMGCSCDWARTRFTLDKVCAKAVYEVFFQWFKAGLIYRGLRLVNWDAFLQTAVADDEIVHETVKGSLWHYRYPILPTGTEAPRQQGNEAAVARAVSPDARLGIDYLTIATTRPETMLGDTAIAVHPNDERYRHLIGRHCLLPLVSRPIPIIADAILVKQEFGTGCVKVTPGHDPNDYAFAQRHNVPMINILAPDGKINENGGSYEGLDRYEARKKVVADLEALGLVEKIEPYETEVGHSDRSKTPIEPMLSEQWFVKMGDLAETAMEAVRDGRVQFFPPRYASTFLDWLGEKRDWCISRQLWWGHRIPVWRKDIFTLSPDTPNSDSTTWIPLKIESLAPQEYDKLCVRYRPQPGKLEALICVKPSESEIIKKIEAAGFVQDPDVLDTWFSSALWPFSTLGWPHDEQATRQKDTRVRPSRGSSASLPGCLDASLPSAADLDYFYPTSVLITGREIITLWVARMVMTGLYFMGRVPFQHVYIHPNIQDGQGRRMSKSLGNGVDPLDIVELYGTDALRFTMAQMATETQDARMPVKAVKLPDGRKINTSEKFELGRNFCNKVWQVATGFVLPNLEALRNEGTEARREGSAGVSPAGWPRPLRTADLLVEDRWILSRLGGCIAEVDRRFDRYQTNEVANTLYTFFWSDFCDWYVELVKPRLFGKDASGNVVSRSDDSANAARQVLGWVLDQSLRLLHPLIPFITEALWKKIGEAAPQRGITELRTAEPALITAAWPDAGLYTRDPQVERAMAALQDVIRALRDTLARINTARAAAKTPAIGKLPWAVIRAEEGIAGSLREQHAVLERLGRCERIELGADATKPPESATQVLTGVEVYVPLTGLMDLAAERKRLQKERDDLGGHIQRLDAKLANEGFVSKAPAAVVEQERARLADMKDRLATLERNLADIVGST